MKISDILERDPAKFPLVNNGQARIIEESDENVVRELKAELSTFVCEGQFSDGMHRIVNSFLKGLGHTSQKGSWVSGFYGSGKSHLLKMLCHLWQNTEFPDGSTARSLVPVLPNDVNAVLLAEQGNFINEADSGREENIGGILGHFSCPVITHDCGGIYLII